LYLPVWLVGCSANVSEQVKKTASHSDTRGFKVLLFADLQINSRGFDTSELIENQATHRTTS
jgi:hypothetical protein